MKVALIGGGSQSARALVRFAKAKAPELAVVPFVRESSPLPRSEVFEVKDYADISERMLAGCDVAINFVGTREARDRQELFKVNAELPGRLAATARAAGVRHFIHLSSLSLYGRAQWIDAHTPLAPVSDYGRSKAAAEEAIAFLDSAAFRVTMLRIPVIYGPRHSSKLSQLAAMLAKLRAFPAPRDVPRRSVISYENLSRVLLDLLRSPRSGVVFAADPQPFRLDEFARLLPSRPRIIRMPAAFLAPLRWVAPSTHHSLFEAMEIDESCLHHPHDLGLVPTEQSLREAFG